VRFLFVGPQAGIFYKLGAFYMARQVQLRRGTTAQNDKFTGAPGEVTVDTDRNTLRVHDGVTPGGTKLAREDAVQKFPTSIPESDAPNSILSTVAIKKERNGYVKFGNGLIIQWGEINPTTSKTQITFDIPFSANCTPIITHGTNTTDSNYCCISVGATGFKVSTTATGVTWVFRWIAIGH